MTCTALYIPSSGLYFIFCQENCSDHGNVFKSCKIDDKTEPSVSKREAEKKLERKQAKGQLKTTFLPQDPAILSV